MIGSIDEEENLIYLSEYEKKFILGKVSQEETLDAQAYSYENEKTHNQKRSEIFIDTDKIPSIRLFRMFKRNTSNNQRNDRYSTNYPFFSHIERKKVLTESFSTSHLFSSVLESASAIPKSKQIRTIGNKKKNAVDSVLLYDTKFHHDTEIERKAKLRTKELVKEKSAEREKEMKGSASENKPFKKNVEELGVKSSIETKENIAKNLKSKSVHFIDDYYALTETNDPSLSSRKTARYSENPKILIESFDDEITEISFKPISHEKLYNKFKRTKKIVTDSKDKNESGKNKVKFILEKKIQRFSVVKST
jgi:hypothetical protein